MKKYDSQNIRHKASFPYSALVSLVSVGGSALLARSTDDMLSVRLDNKQAMGLGNRELRTEEAVSGLARSRRHACRVF